MKRIIDPLMKRINDPVMRDFYDSLLSLRLLHGEVVFGNSVIKVYCSDDGILTSRLLSFVHDFCISKNLLYYVSNDPVSGRLYVLLFR